MAQLDVTKAELQEAKTQLETAIHALTERLNTMDEYRNAEDYELHELSKDELEHMHSLIERIMKSL